MRRKMVILVAMTIVLGAVGCAKTAEEQMVNLETIESEQETSSETESCIDTASWEDRSLIIVKDKLYYYTGEESTSDERCGNMDGKITSEVSAGTFPTEDGQTNDASFVGCGYQYGLEGYIEVCKNDSWYVFKEIDNEYGISTMPMEVLMKVTDYTDGIITLVIDNQSGYVYTYKEDFEVSLEKLEDSGEWNAVPLVTAECGWSDTIYELQDLETVEIKQDLSIFGTLTSGTYRIWKYDLCAEFEIP